MTVEPSQRAKPPSALTERRCDAGYPIGALRTAAEMTWRGRRCKSSLYLSSRVCGILPPFAASFLITSLCSQMFIVAESFVSPL